MEIRNYQRSKTDFVPRLAHIQRNAYERFLQKNVPPARRKNRGLESLFRETFPIKSHDGSVSLEYLFYEIGEPRYNPDMCRGLKISYGAALKARLRLNKPEPIEETVYLGEVPLMIGGGEFVINGVERVIVSQLHRSPGIDFLEEKEGETVSLSAWIIPTRGSWIEIAITKKGVITIRIDQSGKIPITTFMRAMDKELSTMAQIIHKFYPIEQIKITSQTSSKTLQDKCVASDIIDKETGKLVLEAGNKLQENVVNFLIESSVKQIDVIKEVEDFLILNTLAEDPTHSHEEALLKIYSRMRPGMPLQVDRAKTVFYERFFDSARYQLGRVGRFRLNRKLGLNISETEQSLRSEDIISAVRYLIKMRKGEGEPDDIDYLGNRRVRTIDELAAEEIRKGFLRLKRGVTERLSLGVEAQTTPRTLINSKAVSSAIDHFFERGELSQVVDQTNPLSQMTHERRLSALGPGGLNRKRASFEVRDVHPSHYGRICPIETPEGANIGLITSLGISADIDKYGFLITPYRKVDKTRVLDEVVYLRADEEMDKDIAPADTVVKGNRLVGDKIMARRNEDFHFVDPEAIQYMDVSAQQIVGVSTGLIPFLEHNDANRALMGANMQRQAVPLLTCEEPLVSTGIEKYAAENSSMVIRAKREGIVTKVTADQITVRTDNEETGSEFTIYNLKKFVGLNERTCFNQKPIVKEGNKIKKGQVIADGPATVQGELALGKNVLVAFLSWEGYNFEDAIVVSERLLKDDVFTSIHVEEFEIEARETKLGREEFTRDIPNVSEKALKNLDERGFIRVGTRVKPGDILVGKIVPKSKSELTPEEKLLHAIFGKAGEDVKNESFEVPPGVEGIVINIQHFARKMQLGEREKEEYNKTAKKIERQINDQIELLLQSNINPIERAVGKRLLPHPLSYGPRGAIKNLNDLKSKIDLSKVDFEDRKQQGQIEERIRMLIVKCERLENEKEQKISRLLRGDELPTGVMEMLKVRVATKRNLSVGDKMAGRHGNKGVIAKILREEEMPYLTDGTHIDVLLNPLGVPSRMNLGQILETHLGWAAKKLNLRVITPVFNGANEEEITQTLVEAGLSPDGKVTLYDGRTGLPFNEKVTVGYLYMMKLHHLVDDKIHARATGPYSLITQQPLGGKARYGGQRFGEMEVWALEAYGAASVLQEVLTVKSDDVDGRTKIYESMIKGENILNPNVPVSFEVLTNEIRGLCLNLKLEKEKKLLP